MSFPRSNLTGHKSMVIEGGNSVCLKAIDCIYWAPVEEHLATFFSFLFMSEYCQIVFFFNYDTIRFNSDEIVYFTIFSTLNNPRSSIFINFYSTVLIVKTKIAGNALTGKTFFFRNVIKHIISVNILGNFCSLPPNIYLEQ